MAPAPESKRARAAQAIKPFVRRLWKALAATAPPTFRLARVRVRLRVALPLAWTDEFGTLQWVRVTGFPWWPAEVVDPRRVDGELATLAREAVGRAHLVRFLAEKPRNAFCLVPPAELVARAEGVARGFADGARWAPTIRSKLQRTKFLAALEDADRFEAAASVWEPPPWEPASACREGDDDGGDGGDDENVQWAECSRCAKWRKLARGAIAPGDDDRWTCEDGGRSCAEPADDADYAEDAAVDEVEFETSPFLVFDGLHYFEKRRVSHDAADEAREAPAPAATDESRSQGGPGDDRASLRAEPP